MTPRTRIALTNLRAGIQKMENKMSRAAQVRREFRLGRPPKQVENMQPLRADVVWEKASAALNDFKARMSMAGLDPEHVSAAIVFVAASNMDEPHPLMVLESEKETALSALNRLDVIALGMVFGQLDGQQMVYFPHLFMPLNQRGMAVLKRAAEEQRFAAAILDSAN